MDQILTSEVKNTSLATPELLKAIKILSGLHLEKKRKTGVTYAMRNAEEILAIINNEIETNQLELFVVTDFSQSLAFQGAFFKEFIKMTEYDLKGTKIKEWFEPLETPLIFEKSIVTVKIFGYGGEFHNTCIYETALTNFRQNNMTPNQKAGSSKSYCTKYTLECTLSVDNQVDDDHVQNFNAIIEKLQKENEALKAKLAPKPIAEKPTFAQKNYDGVIEFLEGEKDLVNIKTKFNGLQKAFIPDADGLHKKAILAFETKIKQLENV
jgi:hypothetical protein